MASVKLWSEADCNKLIDAVRHHPVLWKTDDSGYHCSRRRCRRLRRLSIIIATAAAAVAATNQLTKSSSSSSSTVLPENTNKNGAITADGNNLSDVIMAWRGRGTHRLYNVVVQPVAQGDHLVAEPKPGHFLKPIHYLRNMLWNIKFTQRQYAYNGLLCIAPIFYVKGSIGGRPIRQFNHQWSR